MAKSVADFLIDRERIDTLLDSLDYLQRNSQSVPYRGWYVSGISATTDLDRNGVPILEDRSPVALQYLVL